MFKKIVIALLVIAAIITIIVRLQPDEFRVARATTISAPPEAVFEQVNDFRNWAGWSPWEKLDPGMKKTFTGPESGVGASYAWAGNKKVGEGSMTITESRAPELVRIRLVFLKPFSASNETEFTFVPEGNQTVVTWAMSGKNNFMAKAVHLVMDMDKMVGGDFDKGLAQMKTLVESGAERS